MHSIVKLPWATSLVLLGLAFPDVASADEPYEQFLTRLKDQRHFGVAEAYLDRLSSRKDLTPLFKAGLELERGMLQYQSAMMLQPKDAKRKDLLTQSEKSIRNFLDTRKNHPNRGAGRLKLGEILLLRAAEANEDADPSQDNKEAIQYYESAHKLFESTIQELATVLDKIKGARTDASDTKAVAYRKKVQQDLRQAQLLSAKSIEERGRSRAEGSKPREADLKTAEKMFTDLYLKEQRMVGVRNYSLYYRSLIQRDLGKKSDAIDGFQRVADLQNIDALRPLQTTANTELLILMSAEGKFQPAVTRAEKWVAGLRPDEKNTVETSKLKLELGKAKVAWANRLKKADAQDSVAKRLIRDTRSDLRSLSRVPGPHQEETRELLSKLGMDITPTEVEDEELPSVKTFAEALTEGQKRLERAETDSLGIAILQEEGKTSELGQLEAKISSSRKQALSLFKSALALYRDEDNDLAGLYQARFSMSYLYLREQQPWESLVIARFVSENNAGSPIGLKAASVALGAFSNIWQTAGEADRKALTDYLDPFATYLVKTWPDSQEAAASSTALVQAALINGQWDKVDQFLALAPKEGDAMLGLRRDAGISFFNRYLDEKKKSGDSAAAKSLKKRALESLQIATKDLDASKLDDGYVNAVNALTRMYLTDNQIDKAVNLLVKGKASPIKALDANAEAVSAKSAMNSYRTAIQLVVTQLASGSLSSQAAVAESKKYITALQAQAKRMPDGQKTLSSIFYVLAKDLKDQMAEVQQPDKRKRLSEATIMLAEQAGSSPAFNTKYWAVDTILSIAEELSASASGKAAGKSAYATASTILQQILSAQESDSTFINPAGLKTQVQLQLARSERGAGDYKSALDTLAKLLASSNSLLPAQVEAAKTYQAWGDAVDSRLHWRAYMGGRPDKNKKNIIWGWGKIAQVLAGKPQYEETFFLARYELARSRYKYASGLKNAESKKKEMAKVKKDVTGTAALYPQLGGPELTKKFDNLLKAAQKQLNEKVTGLKK